MAATDLDICNMALAHLGITQTISSIATPTTKEEKVFARFYPHIRKLLLEGHPWGFARRRAVLTEATGVTLDGWNYAYDLPTNFLKPRQLFVNSLNEAKDQRATYELITKDDGSARVLVCDLEPVTATGPILIYTIDIVSTMPTIFPVYFDDAFAAALANAVAMPLRVDTKIVQYVRALAREQWLSAKGSERGDAETPVPPEAEHIRARS